MRFLTLLSVLQIAAIIALLIKTGSLERIVSDLGSNQLVIGDIQSLGRNSPAALPPLQLDETQIRNIVREELSAALEPFSVQHSPQQTAMAPTTEQRDVQQAKDYQYQLEIVSGEIDYYLSRGSISEQEMSALQLQLAALDQPGRKQMMRKLLKAMNSGELDGRF